MGAGLRIYIIKDDESLYRLPVTKFQRLLRFDPREKLIQYAGNRVRCCSLVIEFKARKPQQIIQGQYYYLYFGIDGQLDPEHREAKFELLLNGGIDICSGQFVDNVLDFSQYFRTKQFINKYRWVPSPAIEAAIENEVFNKGKSIEEYKALE